MKYIRIILDCFKTHREIENLAMSMYKRSYSHIAPDWKPLKDGTGMLSQISNMHIGVVYELEDIKKNYQQYL